MGRQAIRIGVALAAMFYAVAGGMWATSYFPLQQAYAQAKKREEIRESFVKKFGIENWVVSPENFDSTAVSAWETANDYMTEYSLRHPDISDTERRIAFYESLLLWGTIALGAGGTVLFLTRGKRAV